MAYVVAEKDATVTSQQVRDHLAGRVASWWIPETIHFVDQIPGTATGRFSKKTLREHRPLETPTHPAATGHPVKEDA